MILNVSMTASTNVYSTIILFVQFECKKSSKYIHPSTKIMKFTTFILLAALCIAVTRAAEDDDKPHACWRNSYGRGVGTIPQLCPSGTSASGAFCYRSCASGYYGVGPVCWSYCPQGMTDIGALCSLTAHTVSSNTNNCPWYNKCGFGSSCNTCPSGYADRGCLCTRDARTVAKSSYGRGVGNLKVCAAGKDTDAGLCYNKCDEPRYSGVGPVCWQKTCPAKYPVPCGAMCGAPGFSCSEKVGEIIKIIANTVASCVKKDVAECVEGSANTAKEFAIDGLCSAP